ncbi:hypothetical protein HOS75_gp025 [Gordonia phage SteveFrench]|uniref:Uncharacterized protein n=2 Tax=Montyvirus stevefrench TaxID=2734258 RepID=A0A890V5R9_9CAUD|nr:hypothetical protein HOS75_gp025 [Gordonia phage SteveFrench]AUV60705.1 hypothetical protein SEA_STEVEFRENCH_103 [Gordonia phage SteveFrench]QRI45688.1 hypothetical protein SEA_ROYALG_104 [Gordonia phage RoyalG]
MATFNQSPNRTWHTMALRHMTETLADIDGSGDEAILAGHYRLRGEPWRRTPDEGMWVHVEHSTDGWEWHDMEVSMPLQRRELDDPTRLHNIGVELIGRVARAEYSADLDRLTARN